MTEWVTIKIPETIRDDAREDDRTYGEIMEAGLDQGPAKGAPENPWNAGDDINDVLAEFNGPVTLSDSERQAVAREVSRQLDYAELSRRVASGVVEELR